MLSVKQGDPARLFPVLAESSREKRLTSVLLATLPLLPELTREIFAGIAPKIGKTTTVSTMTEVVFRRGSAGKDRPDGLITINTRGRTWSALVEAKAGKASLEKDQLSRYLKIAAENGVDAVISISNEYVTRPEHSPTGIPREDRGDVQMFHLSWMQIRTACAMLASREMDDPLRSMVLAELDHMLSNEKAGVERFSSMGSSWTEVVDGIANRAVLSPRDTCVLEAVSGWEQELQDLTLQMSRHVGEMASEKIERRYQACPMSRQKALIDGLLREHVLRGTLEIPGAAAPLHIVADFLRKNLSVSMRLRAPDSRGSTLERVTWLTDQLSEMDEQIIVRALWPGRATHTQAELSVLHEDPLALCHGKEMLPSSFEVIMSMEKASKFRGPRTVIQELERIVPLFHDRVASQITPWSPPPKTTRTVVPRSADRRSRLFWQGAFEGLLTHQGMAPVVVMEGIHRLAERVEDLGSLTYPDAVRPIMAEDLDPVSARKQLSEALEDLQGWSSTIKLEEADVEDHFLGFCAAVARYTSLTKEEDEDLQIRSSHDPIVQSEMLAPVLEAIDDSMASVRVVESILQHAFR